LGGGKTVPNLFEWIGFATFSKWIASRRGEITEFYIIEMWESFPENNIYQYENKLFNKILAVRKATEFPLDFILNFKIDYLFFFALYFSVNAIKELYIKGTLSLIVLVPLMFWVMFIFEFIPGLHNYSQRREEGNM
jgi:hypothetical protein